MNPVEEEGRRDADTTIMGVVPVVSIRSRNTQMMVGLYAHK
eukprot:CAMPEP_0171315742 /NCGR_PEP_ID=MMETSP0816-20121228/66770_1 /TAXON_ID=420281 /ORGANISM="Proboscia inermis, Strain CCAP1064/1" /LENGTH=40 /DNA_ID= /DNA_START= /DNA_END= /DNA_ORIENTATION=